jgi:hypothetical protein
VWARSLTASDAAGLLVERDDGLGFCTGIAAARARCRRGRAEPCMTSPPARQHSSAQGQDAVGRGDGEECEQGACLLHEYATRLLEQLDVCTHTANSVVQPVYERWRGTVGILVATPCLGQVDGVCARAKGIGWVCVGCCVLPTPRVVAVGLREETQTIRTCRGAGWCVVPPPTPTHYLAIP